MRLSPLLPVLTCLASAGCSTVSLSPTLSTDVWLCAYQLGDRYRDEAAKPDVIKYDLKVVPPVRQIELTYLLPVEGRPPEQHTMACEAAPWGFGVVVLDGFKLARPQPDAYPGDASETPELQGRTSDKVRDAVRETGLHVHIPGVPSF
ncbi:hypothetical protein GCM10011611_29770 [Aliidongia dinghuensis]|uniref:Lipoprotein n=1 Tax=Aliidongia dinghuensis TaxID=1867774 RepID=A0A8J2YVQ8_9PROT|nr:hypothetical protein [Aliidongia dinghuensis]GGF21740.1 hypothetical protein GCM10011611_29770 [Aliidongia dinghuensis]